MVRYRCGCSSATVTLQAMIIGFHSRRLASASHAYDLLAASYGRCTLPACKAYKRHQNHRIIEMICKAIGGSMHGTS